MRRYIDFATEVSLTESTPPTPVRAALMEAARAHQREEFRGASRPEQVAEAIATFLRALPDIWLPWTSHGPVYLSRPQIRQLAQAVADENTKILQELMQGH